MLEIFMLFTLGRNIANKARRKGQSGAAAVLILLALWFGGEIFGAIVGAVLSGGKDILVAYIGAIFGAIIGACIAFTIVSSMPDQAKDSRDEEPWRSGRREIDIDRGFREAMSGRVGGVQTATLTRKQTGGPECYLCGGALRESEEATRVCRACRA